MTSLKNIAENNLNRKEKLIEAEFKLKKSLGERLIQGAVLYLGVIAFSHTLASVSGIREGRTFQGVEREFNRPRNSLTEKFLYYSVMKPGEPVTKFVYKYEEIIRRCLK